MNTENSITLPDGRKLSYAEYGQPDGYPVLFFHGHFTSRLEPLLIGDEVFRQFGMRVIAPDRPGMGRSDFQAQRGFSDWPKDVVFLADAIGLEKFSVLGISGGSGHAVACAAKIPGRLCSAVISSGAWRMDTPEAQASLQFPYSLLWNLASKTPFLLPVMVKMMQKMMGASPKSGWGGELMLAQAEKRQPAADNAVMAEPGRSDVFTRIFCEGAVQGVEGTVWDILLYAREWDFSLSEIQIPLKIFHGEQDMNSPIALVRKVMSDLPSAQLISYPDEAHISTTINHFDEIAKALMPSSQ